MVLFPFHIPIYIPRQLSDPVLNTLSTFRIISPEPCRLRIKSKNSRDSKVKAFIRLRLPVNFVTGPLLADLFLLAISAIDRQEVYYGTIGTDTLSPVDIIAFSLTMGYISISIDSSGLIRYLAWKVIQKQGEFGHRLYLCVYATFFALGAFFGSDPVIEAGTSFIVYMTRLSANLIHPRAWIHTQFAIANLASAILVSSNPANVVLSGAFHIQYIEYTANMIVPVTVTAIFLFPFLLYIVFADESFIPLSIKLHQLPEEATRRIPVNPILQTARRADEDVEERLPDHEQGHRLLSLEEILNPFLSKSSAAFATIVMAAALVTLLTLSATASNNDQYPVFWVTLPAAFLIFSWQISFGWLHRHETRWIARKGREEVERARAERSTREEEARREEEEREERNEQDEQDEQKSPDKQENRVRYENQDQDVRESSECQDQKDRENHKNHDQDDQNDPDGPTFVVFYEPAPMRRQPMSAQLEIQSGAGAAASKTEPDMDDIEKETMPVLGRIDRGPTSTPSTPFVPHKTKGAAPIAIIQPKSSTSMHVQKDNQSQDGRAPIRATSTPDEEQELTRADSESQQQAPPGTTSSGKANKEELNLSKRDSLQIARTRPTLVSLLADGYRWAQETFPDITVVIMRLPYTLVPDILCIFILVQALASTGWIEAFAYGWDRWVEKTGPVGSISGMGFLSTILCNVSSIFSLLGYHNC
jgi:Na+/H+ antiporter NhaD/arsenite permease-like protein